MRLRGARGRRPVGVPFTTGILVGIGETRRERAESLFALRSHGSALRARPGSHRPELPGQGRHRDARPCLTSTARSTSRPSRSPGSCSGRACGSRRPPTSSTSRSSPVLLAAGVDDWGGVSPVTPDHVNPERPWPHLDDLAGQRARRRLRAPTERLTAHPRYVLGGPPWLDPRVLPHVRALADPTTRPAARGRTGRRACLAGAGPDLGRGLLRPGRACTSRSTPRGAPATAAATSTRCTATGARSVTTPQRSRCRLGRGARACSPATSARRCGWPPTGRPRCSSRRTSTSRWRCSWPRALTSTPSARSPTSCARATVGDDVTYVVNRNINFTNVCYVGCRFCAFAQRRTDADAYTLSLDEVGERAAQAWAIGATEICMQGGIDPDLPGTAYFDLARAVKAAAPQIHLHAFSPMEVMNGASRTGLSHRGLPAQRAGGGRRHHPRHRGGDPRRRGPLGADQGQAAEQRLGRGRQHRAPARHPVELDDDVRPRRQPAALGRPPAAAGRGAGRHRRVHRVRAAAVRAHQRADLPRRRRPARADDARQPRRARDGAAAAARRASTTSRPRGSSSASRAPRPCSGPAPTTSAAR